MSYTYSSFFNHRVEQSRSTIPVKVAVTRAGSYGTVAGQGWRARNADAYRTLAKA